MNRLAVFLSGLAGVAIWIGLVVAGAGHVDSDRAATTPDTISTEEMAEMAADAAAFPPLDDAVATLPDVALPATADTTAAVDDGQAADKAASDAAAAIAGGNRAVRPVEPDTFEYPVADGTGPLERIDPRPPLSDKLAGRDPVVLPRPGTVKAGLLAFGQRNLQLADVVSTDMLMRCKDAAGNDWPCGSAARTALRLFLRNRSISCDLPSKQWQGEATATCRLGEKNIGEWLVENGWAQAVKGSPFEKLGEEAKTARRGLYGDDPRKKPETRTPAIP